MLVKQQGDLELTSPTSLTVSQVSKLQLNVRKNKSQSRDRARVGIEVQVHSSKS